MKQRWRFLAENGPSFDALRRAGVRYSFHRDDKESDEAISQLCRIRNHLIINIEELMDYPKVRTARDPEDNERYLELRRTIFERQNVDDPTSAKLEKALGTLNRALKQIVRLTEV